VLPVPLLPQAERVEPLGPIHCEHPVEVINLVLKELCTITLHLDFLPVTFKVLIPNSDPIGAGNPNEEVGEGKTIVPYFEVLGADVNDLGIDQRPWSIHLDVHHPNRSADLRR
jgi:hypothetical protein